MLDARRGAPDSAAARLRESLEQARALPDPGAAVAALNNLSRLLADSGQPGEALPLAQEALALGCELGDQHRVAALHTNLADLLHAAGQREAALAHLKEAARGFASVDSGGTPRPEVWTSWSGSDHERGNRGVVATTSERATTGIIPRRPAPVAVLLEC